MTRHGRRRQPITFLSRRYDRITNHRAGSWQYRPYPGYGIDVHWLEWLARFNASTEIQRMTRRNSIV